MLASPSGVSLKRKLSAMEDSESRAERVDRERRRLLQESGAGMFLPSDQAVPLSPRSLAMNPYQQGESLRTVSARGDNMQPNELDAQRTASSSAPNSGTILAKLLQEQQKRNSIIRKQDLELISSLQARLQMLETELIKVKINTSEKPPVPEQDLLKQVSRLETERREMNTAFREMQKKLSQMQKQINLTGQVSESKASSYDVGRVELESKMTSGQAIMRANEAENVIRRALSRTSALESQIKQLETALSMMDEKRNLRENDLDTQSRAAMERLDRLNSMITKKEAQLSDHIKLVQSQLGSFEDQERANGERRLRIMEQHSNMVRDATDRRVTITESGLAKERSARIAGENQLRKEMEIKMDSFSSSLREHEAILKSANDRFIRETYAAVRGQEKRIAVVEKRIASNQNRLDSYASGSKRDLENARKVLEEKAAESTKRMEDLLRAEIKVRSSAVAKCNQAQAEHVAMTKNEMSKIASSNSSKLELFSSKLGELETSMQDQDLQLRKELSNQLAESRDEHQKQLRQMTDKVEAAVNKLNSVSAQLQEQHNALSESTNKRILETQEKLTQVETSFSERLSKTHEELSNAILDLSSSSETKLEAERTTRSEQLQSTQRYLQDLLVHAVKESDRSLAQVKAEVTELRATAEASLDKMGADLRREISESSELLQSAVAQSSRGLKQEIQDKKLAADASFEAHRTEHAQIRERIASVHAQIDSSLHASKAATQDRLQQMEAQAKETNGYVDHLGVKVLEESQRALESESRITERVASTSRDTLKRLEAAMASQSKALEALVDESRRKAKAYTDHKTTVLRSLFRSSVSAEAANRVENIRWTREDLTRLSRLQEQLQQKFTVEKFKILYDKMEALVDDERDKRQLGDGRLRVELKDEITDVQGLLREEAELRSLVDSMCRQVEQDIHAQVHANIDAKQQSTESALDGLSTFTASRFADAHSRIGKETAANASKIKEEEQSRRAHVEEEASERKAQIEKEIGERNEQLKSVSKRIDMLAVEQVASNMETKVAQETLEHRLEDRFTSVKSDLVKESKTLQGRIEQEAENSMRAVIDLRGDVKHRLDATQALHQGLVDQIEENTVQTTVVGCLDSMLNTILAESSIDQAHEYTDAVKAYTDVTKKGILERVSDLDASQINMVQSMVDFSNENNALRSEQANLEKRVSQRFEQASKSLEEETGRLRQDDQELGSRVSAIDERVSTEVASLLENDNRLEQRLDESKQELFRLVQETKQASTLQEELVTPSPTPPPREGEKEALEKNPKQGQEDQKEEEEEEEEEEEVKMDQALDKVKENEAEDESADAKQEELVTEEEGGQQGKEEQENE